MIGDLMTKAEHNGDLRIALMMVNRKFWVIQEGQQQQPEAGLLLLTLHQYHGTRYYVRHVINSHTIDET